LSLRFEFFGLGQEFFNISVGGVKWLVIMTKMENIGQGEIVVVVSMAMVMMTVNVSLDAFYKSTSKVLIIVNIVRYFLHHFLYPKLACSTSYYSAKQKYNR
jgi:hypothetical protein